MSTLKEAKRKIIRVFGTDLFITDGSNITPLLVGVHGLGKTAIAHNVANALGGVALVIDGSFIKEGELPGIPYSVPKSNDSTERCMKFAPYRTTAQIQEAEKEIYQQAITTGFVVDGKKLYLDNDPKSKNYGCTIFGNDVIIKKKDHLTSVLEGGLSNPFSFGEELPGDIKTKLIASHQIRAAVIILDEMNRTDVQTMKEFMNVVLNKNINGYQLPWWSFFIAAINPSDQSSDYATNIMDPAQKDRFLQIDVEANLDEWIDYSIETGMDPEFITALASVSADIFAPSNANTDTDSEIGPSPRSWTACCYLWQYREEVNKSGFLSPEDIACTDKDMKSLFNGKVGVRATGCIIEALRSRKWFVDVPKVLSGTSAVLTPEDTEKIKDMPELTKVALTTNIVNFIAGKGSEEYYSKSPKDKKIWENRLAQIKNINNLLPASMQLRLAQLALNTIVKRTSGSVKQTVFALISSTIVDTVMDRLMSFKSLKEGN